MTKKMLLALICVVALALSASNGASAGEIKSHCFGAATCTGTVQSTSWVEFIIGGGLRVTCTEVTGSMTVGTETSTGSAQMLFHGCKLNIGGGACQSGISAGTITTNVLTTHYVRIDPISLEKPTGTPGILYTGISLDFICNGAGTFVITGNLIGHIETPECPAPRTHHTVSFELTETGGQKHKQVTTTGPVHDLTRAGGSPFTAAFVGTWHIQYASGTSVALTC